mgnify:CR=1 FL=1
MSLPKRCEQSLLFHYFGLTEYLLFLLNHIQHMRLKYCLFGGDFQLRPCQLIGTRFRLRGRRTVQAGSVSKLCLRKGMRQIGCVPTWRGKAVIGQTRLYCSKGEGFRLVEVPTEQAANEAKRLNNQGWRVDAAIPV